MIAPDEQDQDLFPFIQGDEVYADTCKLRTVTFLLPLLCVCVEGGGGREGWGCTWFFVVVVVVVVKL